MNAAGMVLIGTSCLRSAPLWRVGVRCEPDIVKGVTMPFEYPVISADSHITEAPDCYTANIDPAYRDQAPHIVTDPTRGDLFVVEATDVLGDRVE